MNRIIIILLALVYSNCVLSMFLLDNNPLQSHSQIIERNIEILQENGNFSAKIEEESVTQTLRYVIGYRISGDNLIAQGSNAYKYSALQNIKLTLNYPTPGFPGKIVTYCEVMVDQSSSLGRGYVVSGGIGKRQLGIVIEANSTIYLAYKASFYGL